MSGAYLPVLPAVRDRANKWLAGMAARGFVPDLHHAVWTNGLLKTRPDDLEQQA